MRPSTAFVLAAAGSQVSAQTSVSVGAPVSTLTPSGPPTGKLGNATVVENNPVGVVYVATFPKEPFFKGAYPDGGNIQGSVVASAASDGVGVQFTIRWSNLPKTGGPFMYHLHVNPVPENGNCTATLAHLDPFERFEDPICDPKLPETCQPGDLSGKYGDIPNGQETFETTYHDLYASTLEGLGSFFGNRSIVFHYANKTRVSCANFVKKTSPGPPPGFSGRPSSFCSTGGAKPTGVANATGSSPAPTGATTTGASSGSTSTASPVPAGAATNLQRGAAGAGIIAFAAAIMFML
ncbi:hypothetical protein OQA88_3835 [Cercophora sp. LCS_1]